MQIGVISLSYLLSFGTSDLLRDCRSHRRVGGGLESLGDGIGGRRRSAFVKLSL